MKNTVPTITENITLLLALRSLFPELDKHNKRMCELLKQKFEADLQFCYNHDDLMKRIIAEIDSIKEILQNNFYVGLAIAADKPMRQLSEEKDQRIQDLESFLKFENITIEQLKNSAIEGNVSDKKSITLLFDVAGDTIKGKQVTLKTTRSKGKKGKKQDEVLESDFMVAIALQFIRLHYIREYYAFLIECFQEHDKGLPTGPKIQWLGTQRDLAEWFIEGVAKRYMPKADVKKIKAFFTKSASIEKLLDYKGDFIPHLNRHTYPLVYPNTEIAKFDKIVENPKPEKVF